MLAALETATTMVSTIRVGKTDTMIVGKTDTMIVEKTDTMIVGKTDTMIVGKTDTMIVVVVVIMTVSGTATRAGDRNLPCNPV